MTLHSNRTLRAAVATALFGLATPVLAAAGWTLVDLGTLGGRSSYASALSETGLVAGCSEAADGSIRAFVYADGSMRDLGAGCALAVNDSGVAAGRAGNGELVIWAGGTVTPLGVGGSIGGMNESGAVVGSRTVGDSMRAFVYRDGALADIGEPGVRSEAAAINASGQVVGSAGGHAFLYDGGAMRDLGTLGGNNSAARGINARGEVVGMASNEFGAPTPFVYGDAMQPLAGPAYSAAIAINTSGTVVGSGEGVSGYLVQGATVTRLGELPAVAAKGWRHLEPAAINDRGWVAGTAENSEGDLRAFLLVPGPASKPYRQATR